MAEGIDGQSGRYGQHQRAIQTDVLTGCLHVLRFDGENKDVVRTQFGQVFRSGYAQFLNQLRPSFGAAFDNVDSIAVLFDQTACNGSRHIAAAEKIDIHNICHSFVILIRPSETAVCPVQTAINFTLEDNAACRKSRCRCGHGLRRILPRLAYRRTYP